MDAQPSRHAVVSGKSGRVSLIVATNYCLLAIFTWRNFSQNCRKHGIIFRALQRPTATAIPSLHPSVCLPRADVVNKRIKLRPRGLYLWIAWSFLDFNIHFRL